MKKSNLCGEEIDRKEKYCSLCLKLKGDLHFSKFRKQAEKITHWQTIGKKEYIKSISDFFPCTNCNKEHLTYVGGPALCIDCKKEKNKIRKEKLKEEKEKARIAQLKIEKELEELKRNQEIKKLAKEKFKKDLEPYLKDIKEILLNDLEWTFWINEKNHNDQAFYKNEYKISSNLKKAWKLQYVYGGYGSYYFQQAQSKREYFEIDFIDLIDELPDEAKEILNSIKNSNQI